MPSYKVTEKAKSDLPVIVMGLILFVVILVFGTAYNLANGQSGKAPTIGAPALGKHCVKPKAWMRENHMKLLDDWRNQVVREGKRGFVTVDGKRYEKSLTKGCLHCHQSKARFCDQCHRYTGLTRPGVKLDCWNCHIIPSRAASTPPAVRAAKAGR